MDQHGADALRLWAQFPVNATPRPLVLVGPTVREDGGFDSGEAKLAHLKGAIDPAVTLAVGVLEAICPQDTGDYDGPRLQVTAAQRVTSPFMTDRGMRDLPAWQVAVSGFNGAIFVLDPTTAAKAWYPPGGEYPGRWDPRLGQAILHEDGKTLTLTYMGAPRAHAGYSHVAVHESDSAVLMLPVYVIRPQVAGRYAEAPGEDRHVSATLARPFGARVLVTSTGTPLPVTPPSHSSANCRQEGHGNEPTGTTARRTS